MRRWLSLLLAVVASVVFSLVVPAAANPHECRVPLHDGKLRTADLSQALLDRCHLRGMTLDAGSVDLSSLRGATFIKALDAALGEGARISVEPDALVLHVDPDRLPHDLRDAKKAVRVFTAEAAPQATAAQRRFYGLLMPKSVSQTRPMVVLIHGLDCNRTNWFPMARLLTGQGYQVTYFTYPSDQPLQDSADLLAREMSAVRETFPRLKVNVIAHSMGGLVARDYIESSAYAGGVDHLILIGTPNLGTRWAACRLVLEAEEHYGLWKHEKEWSPTWIITDGLGEAGRDLSPNSEFLDHLNARPRRAGVRYTIIAGSQNPLFAMGANATEALEKIVPSRVSQVWGFRQTRRALEHATDKLRNHKAKSDGPVKLSSTLLAGVTDRVVLNGDHTSLYYPEHGQPPVAWETIKDRLAR
jgi:pimeloyl-ACP methyl ester carboxylesterase